MDLSWCHIHVGIKVIFSNNKDFSVWPLHALIYLYALDATDIRLLRMRTLSSTNQHNTIRLVIPVTTFYPLLTKEEQIENKMYVYSIMSESVDTIPVWMTTNTSRLLALLNRQVLLFWLSVLLHIWWCTLWDRLSCFLWQGSITSSSTIGFFTKNFKWSAWHFHNKPVCVCTVDVNGPLTTAISPGTHLGPRLKFPVDPLEIGGGHLSNPSSNSDLLVAPPADSQCWFLENPTMFSSFH